jgi:hypothetical protein
MSGAQANECFCQWEGCVGDASKHVIFSYQPTGVTEVNERGVAFGVTVRHANLCEFHIAEIQKRSADVDVKDLGQCPYNCRC